MRPLILHAAVLSIMVVFRSAGAALPSEEPTIRVLLNESGTSFVLTSSAAWNVAIEGEHSYGKLPPGEFRIVQSSRTLTLSRTSITGPLDTMAGPVETDNKAIVLTPVELGAVLAISGSTKGPKRLYIGSITFHPGADGKLQVVAKLPLEQYLRGVVPSEIGNDSPLQAKCAQAVAARNAALLSFKGRNHGKAPYDICSTVDCQVYTGVTRVTRDCDAAVNETRGMVLMYQGEPLVGFYAAQCGGHTEDAANPWPGRTGASAYAGNVRVDSSETTSVDLTKEENLRAWIQSEPAVYCNPKAFKIPGWAGKSFRWTRDFQAEALGRSVAKKKDIGRILKLTPRKRGPSGRLIELEFVGEKGSLVVTPEIEIRRIFEPALRSGAFFVDTKGPAERPDAFILHGGGSGHGVGMCQTGAMGMANAGKSYREILEHYYRTAKLKKIY